MVPESVCLPISSRVRQMAFAFAWFGAVDALPYAQSSERNDKTVEGGSSTAVD
jgi:hypothetical protein